MTKKDLLRNLRKQLAWVKSIDKSSDCTQAINVMVAAFQACHESGMGQERINSFVDRHRGQRKAFRNIRERYAYPDGKRALRRLLETAISSVEACPWVNTYSVGALVLDHEPRPVTAATREKLRAAGQKTQRILREQRERLQEQHKSRLSVERA